MSSEFNKGAYGELLVAAELTKKGYRVSLPFETVAPYDLLVETMHSNIEKRFLKLQIKTTMSQPGSSFSGRFKMKKGGKDAFYERQDVDAFIVVDARTAYIMPIPFIPNTGQLDFFYPTCVYDYIVKNAQKIKCADFYHKNWELMFMSCGDVLALEEEWCFYNIYTDACFEGLPDTFTRTQFSEKTDVSWHTAKKFLDDDLGLSYTVADGSDAFWYKKHQLMSVLKKKAGVKNAT